jgi:dTDP-4-amino-4,6-dideoxygalactose transaminase
MTVNPFSVSSDEYIIFGSPRIDEDEIQEVVDSMRKGWLGTGPKVARFEDDFKTYRNASYAAAVNSCTAALHLCLITAGLEPGGEVITTPMTFCATVNAIIHAGLTPVLADIDPVTMNVDPNEVERKITPKTQAILPVHFAGRPCDMDALCDIAKRHNLKIIEDCAHAIETEYKGKSAGTFGDFGCFSFYVTKNIVTGEGGMVLAQKEQDIARIKTLALHGMSKDAWKRFSDEGYKHYQVVECGFKYNMMDIQAAIGIHQLKRIESYWLTRQDIWRQYDSAFADLPVKTPQPPEPQTRHAFHLYTLMVDSNRCGITRDEFLDRMNRLGIGCGVHYLSLPEHPYYQERFGWRPQDYPYSMQVGRQTASLPISAKLSQAMVDRIIDAASSVIKMQK